MGVPVIRPMATQTNIAPTHTATITSSTTMDRHVFGGNLLECFPPLTTIITAFARVLDYRTYHQRNKLPTFSVAEGLNMFH